MLIPIWLVILVGALWIARFNLWGAVWLTIAVAGTTVSAGLVHLLNPVQGSRRDLLHRMCVTEGMPIMRMALSALNPFGWAGVAYCFPSGHWIVGLIVLAVVGALTGTRIVRGWQRFRWIEWPAS